MATSPELTEMLRWGRRFGTGTSGGLTNHLPMGLIALERIGAAPDRLELFVDDYTPKLVPIGDRVEDIATGSLLDHIGTARRFPDMLALFDAEVAAHGWRATVRTWLVSLLDGMGSDAFHPLIRLAYGVDAQDPGEVAAGLAYLADARRPIAVVPTDEDATTDLVAVLDGVAADPDLAAADIEGTSIASRMAQIGTLAGFGAHAARWQPGTDALRALALATRRGYAPRPDDFTTMHTVTGLHALRLLLPYLDDPTEALRTFGQAVTAAFVANGLAPLATSEQMEDLRSGTWPAWEEIADAARASRGDEHAYKVTYTCRVEAATHGDEAIYRSLAARLVGAPS